MRHYHTTLLALWFADDVSDASIASAVDIRRAPGRRADIAHSVFPVHLLENASPVQHLYAPSSGATPSTLLATLLEFYLQNDPSPYERVLESSPASTIYLYDKPPRLGLLLRPPRFGSIRFSCPSR